MQQQHQEQNRVNNPLEFPSSKARTIIDMCPICLEPEAVISLFGGCRHGVCDTCRVKLRSKLCPVCRADIPGKEPSLDAVFVGTSSTDNFLNQRAQLDERRQQRLHRFYLRRYGIPQQQQYTREEIMHIAIQAVARVLQERR